MKLLERIKKAFTVFVSASDIENQNTEGCVQEYFDVVIVGAGMAGLAAAKHIQANSGLSVVVLEASNRIGGRVRSNFDFGVDGPNAKGKWTVEDGANWITNYNGNPIYELAEEYNFNMTKNYYWDFVDATYQYSDTATVTPRNVSGPHSCRDILLQR